uniref:Cytochrome P450 monooxygenase n=1 Tax=Bionectria ochroleuca TaxID=29856 RepID=A0A8H7K5R2_BIOOC
MLTEVIEQVPIERMLLLAAAMLIVLCAVSSRLALTITGKPRVKSLISSKSLPGPRFKFPNGQGTEKFFGGRNAARRWRHEYGSIYSIWAGLKREIVLSTPEQVQEFYRDSHLHIKAADNNSGWLFAELLGSCVGVVSQNRWKRVRRPFEHPFSRTSALTRPRTFIHEARDFLSVLNPNNEIRTINTSNDLKYCPFFMVASIFFGVHTQAQRNQLQQLGPPREELFRRAFMGSMNRYGIAKYFPGSALSLLRQFQGQWETFVKEAYERAIDTGDGSIVPLWEAVNRGDMSMQELLQTLDESLFANLDVTAHAVSWNVIRIAHHRDIQRKVREEIRRHNESDKAYEEYMCRDDTLIAACVLETSRLHPVLPFSNPEAAEENKTVGDYIIPRRTDVIVDTYAINIDNPHWKDATTFDPHRHLGQKDSSRRYNMWRFGFGPRQCLGKNVADIILRIILAELLDKYEIELMEAEEVADVKLQPDSWIGLPDGIVKMVPMIV